VHTSRRGCGVGCIDIHNQGKETGMKRWLLGWGCLLLSGVAMAAGPAAVRKRVEASMLVTGTITVAPDGHVAGYVLDHPDKLPSTVRDLLGSVVPRWTFEPVTMDGQPVSARAPMSVRVVAKPLGAGRYSISVAGEAFSRGKDVSGRVLSIAKRRPPHYPLEAVRERVAGTVYVMVRVDRQGKVAEAVARQVNLKVVGSDSEMAAWRNMLAKATLRTAREWTFVPPTVGKEASAPYWVAMVPVDYSLSGPAVPDAERRGSYGQWRPYVPGPLQPVPWADPAQLAGSADAVPDEGIFQPNPELRLRTPRGG
jgi:hypothetical protein